MTAQHFNCTACGQCCFGWIPLTLADAFANAGRFPLAMVWTPVRPTSRSYDLTVRLGTLAQITPKQKIAVLLSATAYIPPSFACPALGADNLCAIHECKPQRCKTMPFFPYREEEDQLDLLVPRKGWACDVSADAPVVYSEKKIIDRADFDCERETLLADATVLKAYADSKLAQGGPQKAHLLQAAKNLAAGRYVENFTSFLRYDRRIDLVAFAKQQHPVLQDFAEKTAGVVGLEDYHRYYTKTAEELDWFVKRGEKSGQ